MILILKSHEFSPLWTEVMLMHTMYFDEHTSAICVISEEVNHNIINLAFVHWLSIENNTWPFKAGWLDRNSAYVRGLNLKGDKGGSLYWNCFYVNISSN